MPPASPVLVKRRLTPANACSDAVTTSSGSPISLATAMAASAFWTLCWPYIGSSRFSSRRSEVWARSAITAVKREPAAVISTSTPRTSA